MISIQGLTRKQVTLMDIMWTMDDLAKVNTFIGTLPVRDQQDCRSLVHIATLETLELEGGLDAYKAAAEAAVSSARYS
jgi:hypothetical protein